MATKLHNNIQLWGEKTFFPLKFSIFYYIHMIMPSTLDSSPTDYQKEQKRKKKRKN